MLLHSITASLLFDSELVECDFVQCVCSSVGCCSVFSVFFNVRGMQCAVEQCSVFQCFNVSARYAAECQLVWCGSAAGRRVVILANFTF